MKALIAMSGGVDSSVAVQLTKNAGYEALGCTLLLCEGGKEGVEDAKRVADALSVPLSVFDLQDRFKEEIVLPFMESYRRGMTPNPCVLCNQRIKFGWLFEKAEALACDLLVTGHYARIVKEGEHFLLKKARDEAKDQSYMLYTLKESMLSRLSFPLGEYTKEEIRALADSLSLPNAKKKDSQDICFIENGRYAERIEEIFGKSPIGDYIDKEGKVLGKHRGLIHYTVGQHKKLGISFPTPLYVLSLLPAENQVVLGSNEDLYTKTVHVPLFSFIASEGAPADTFRAKAKIRYRQKEEPCTVTVCGDGVTIEFDSPQRAVTPGQSAVLYDGDTVLGGGIIQ